jgi:hypothetical protein
VFVLLLVLTIVAIYATAGPTPSAGGATTTTSDAPVVTFFTTLLPWPIVFGLIWLFFARFTVERRLIKSVLITLGVVAVIMAATTAWTTPLSSRAAPKDGATAWSELLPFAILLLGGAVMLFQLQKRGTRVAWEAQPQLSEPVRIEADENGFVSSGAHRRFEYGWPAVISFSEGEHVFVLSHSAVGFTPVPKRAFASPQDLEGFRALLRSKTVDSEGGQQGFPVVLPMPPLDSK